MAMPKVGTWVKRVGKCGGKGEKKEVENMGRTEKKRGAKYK